MGTAHDNAVDREISSNNAVPSKLSAVFNGHTIAVWLGDGPVLLDLSVEEAKKLRKRLKAAIRDTE